MREQRLTGQRKLQIGPAFGIGAPHLQGLFVEARDQGLQPGGKIRIPTMAIGIRLARIEDQAEGALGPPGIIFQEAHLRWIDRIQDGRADIFGMQPHIGQRQPAPIGKPIDVPVRNLQAFEDRMEIFRTCLGRIGSRIVTRLLQPDEAG